METPDSEILRSSVPSWVLSTSRLSNVEKTATKSVLLIKMGRPAIYTMVPMVFVLVMSFLAGLVTLVQFWKDGNYLLVGLDLVVLVTSLLVILEAASVIVQHRRTTRVLTPSG